MLAMVERSDCVLVFLVEDRDRQRKTGIRGGFAFTAPGTAGLRRGLVLLIYSIHPSTAATMMQRSAGQSPERMIASSTHFQFHSVSLLDGACFVCAPRAYSFESGPPTDYRFHV